eukprot:CAMPEP_0177405186 /NCGR_PEP_ID=MMETSP0368-20130122/61825_1 /TAXON_ID=447022 ORGANISM="Scrippsiella hangoei-like, Strain SHHI-4" /NCGR_SAMPLE_ID=MMETSP0368 /ASSEMBLY_ACC=CAM_ASM_000363 /LENGTH=36 /DNA_ID= /DNA_START= /DNA_END= /DNA_ORIENTATION=
MEHHDFHPGVARPGVRSGVEAAVGMEAAAGSRRDLP